MYYFQYVSCALAAVCLLQDEGSSAQIHYCHQQDESSSAVLPPAGVGQQWRSALLSGQDRRPH